MIIMPELSAGALNWDIVVVYTLRVLGGISFNTNNNTRHVSLDFKGLTAVFFLCLGDHGILHRIYHRSMVLCLYVNVVFYIHTAATIETFTTRTDWHQRSTIYT